MVVVGYSEVAQKVDPTIATKYYVVIRDYRLIDDHVPWSLINLNYANLRSWELSDLDWNQLILQANAKEQAWSAMPHIPTDYPSIMAKSISVYRCNSIYARSDKCLLMEQWLFKVWALRYPVILPHLVDTTHTLLVTMLPHFSDRLTRNMAQA